MKREGGLWAMAAVVGLATTVGISTNQSKPPSASDTAVVHKTIRSAAPIAGHANNTIEDGPCPDIEKLLQTFFLVPEEEMVAPSSCFPEGKNKQLVSPLLQEKLRSMRFMIATLPDPLHTHFSLSFDREIEALQQGAQDEDLVYNSSWLPWETDESSYALLDDQDKSDKRKEQREDQPGFLLFREQLPAKSNGKLPKDQSRDAPFAKGLLILIVGEEPTGGIHRRQFENAVQWIEALQPKPDPGYPLQLLAPSFSGSLPSLIELLKDTHEGLSVRVGQQLRIFSGSVSSNAGVAWLNEAVTVPNLQPLHIEFRSFEHSGDLDLDRYCRYVTATGTELEHLAVVSEDETAFGAEYNRGSRDYSPCRPGKVPNENRDKVGPVYLYYPRDISALRAAYQSQSIFTRATQPSSESSPHKLQSDIADPEGKDHDTVRAYSGNQTALSQEAELLQIVSLMRAHNSQYILLRCSNPLDQLFLSHFFRMTYPAGRIIIVGADLLLRRETGISGLNGVMTLSTYPLLPWEQDWTFGHSGNFHHHRAFTQDGAESTYIAERLLLHPGWITPPVRKLSAAADDEGQGKAESNFVPPICMSDLNLPDYRIPLWMNDPGSGDCHRPPTWLSVLGNGGFWPVAVLDYPTDVGKDQPTDIEQLGQPKKKWGRLRHSITSVGASIAFLFGIKRGDGSDGDVSHGWLAMPPSMKFLMFGGLFWAVFHALCCSRASLTVKPAHRAHFVRPNCTLPQSKEDRRHTHRQQRAHWVLILFGSVLVALLPISLAWGCGEMWEGGDPIPHAQAYRLFLSVIWLIAGFAVFANSWVEEHLFWAKDEKPITQGRFKTLVKIWISWAKRTTSPDTAAMKGATPINRSMEKHIRAGAKSTKLWVTGSSALAKAGRSFFSFVVVSASFYWGLAFALDRALNDSNRMSTYWRAVNLTTGVSPLVPLVALTMGLYGWFWYSLQGLALFGEDRPQLPTADSLKILLPQQQGQSGQPDANMLKIFSMLSRKKAARPIEELSSPFNLSVCGVSALSFVGILSVGCWVFGWPPIRNLGSKDYSFVFCFWLWLCASILLANAFQLARVWLRLRHMLEFLDRLPLRRTMQAFAGLSWGSVWKMSGNALDLRYKIVFRQLESLTHLRASLVEEADRPSSPLAKLLGGGNRGKKALPTARRLICEIDKANGPRVAFAKWYALHWDNRNARSLDQFKSLQCTLADTAAISLTDLLIPAWREEQKPVDSTSTVKAEESEKDAPGSETSKEATLPPEVRNAEELVCLVYTAFIQNVLGRIRSLVLGMACIFLSMTVAVSTYPFDPRALLSGVVVLLFAIVGGTIIFVYVQMHRDATLSKLTGTKPGELGSEFWMKLIGLGVGPLLGLVATVFPEFTDFIFSWVQPGLESIK